MAEKVDAAEIVVPSSSTIHLSHHVRDFQDIASAIMFLITLFPCVTQRGAREMSVWKVAAEAEFASQQCIETFEFLINVLQALHVRIASPTGLLNQRAIHGERVASENRHAEIQLRQFRMGLHQSLAMCHNLTTLVTEEATKVPSPHRRLEDIIARNVLQSSVNGKALSRSATSDMMEVLWRLVHLMVCLADQQHYPQELRVSLQTSLQLHMNKHAHTILSQAINSTVHLGYGIDRPKSSPHAPNSVASDHA